MFFNFKSFFSFWATLIFFLFPLQAFTDENHIQNFFGQYSGDSNTLIKGYKDGFYAEWPTKKLVFLPTQRENIFKVRNAEGIFEDKGMQWASIYNNQLFINQLSFDEKGNYKISTIIYDQPQQNEKAIKTVFTDDPETYFVDGVHNANLKDFLGTYVGKAQEENGEYTRDLDVIIKPFKRGQGFAMEWVTVKYKDDRDQPGVKRKKFNVFFKPYEDINNFFILEQKKNPFKIMDKRNVHKGDPIVWSRLHKNILSTYSLEISSDGSYTIQNYHRQLTKDGMDIQFESHRNGITNKRVIGNLIRVKNSE